MANQTKPQDVNEAKREKKRGGFVARLFGGGGSGGTVGAGAFGGAGGSFGGLFGSGLLATKAGLLALILVGSTVAGGLGLIGYNMMSAGPARPGDEVQLFASKPKNVSPELPPVPQDGASDSLKFFAQANSDPGTPEAPQAASAETPKDATAAGAAVSDAAAGTGPSNVAAATGNGVSTLLKNGKFGQLTAPGAVGKGGVSAAAASSKPGAAAGADSAAASAAHLGKLSAMKNGLASTGGARTISGRKFGSRGALGQAFGAMRDNRSATSSAGGGLTYDGAANAGGNIGANGSAIGPGGEGTGPAQAKNITNPAAVDPSLSPPPTPTAVDKAPWQNAIKTAQMLIGLAVALMLVAKLMAKTQYGKIVAMVIAAVVAGIGGMVIALGAQIANGQYGQKLQGGVLAAAGVGLMIAAAAIAFGGDSSKTDSTGLNTAGADTAAADGSGASGAGGAGGDSGSMLSGINPFVLIGGGLGLIGLAGTMMVPPKKYPSKDFPNGNPPDTHFFGTQLSPSETALKKMVA